jgi:hypothetical protein
VSATDGLTPTSVFHRLCLRRAQRIDECKPLIQGLHTPVPPVPPDQRSRDRDLRQRRVNFPPALCRYHNLHCDPHQSLLPHTRLSCIPRSADSSHPPTFRMCSFNYRSEMKVLGVRLCVLVYSHSPAQRITCLSRHKHCRRILPRVGVPDAERRSQGRVLGRRRDPHRGNAGWHLRQDQGGILYSRQGLPLVHPASLPRPLVQSSTSLVHSSA